MKKLIHSQRFGMISEICDAIAMNIIVVCLKKGLTPIQAAQFALKKRLDWEIELNGASDEVIIDAYQNFVCDK